MLQQSTILVLLTLGSQWQEHQVVSSQSDDINEIVIHHQHEFATTQLGSKTLRKGAAYAKEGK